jgi:hypothetical protein
VTNQDGEPVAVYTILTLVKRQAAAALPTTGAEVERALTSEAPDAVRPPEVMARTEPGSAPARVS